MARQFEESQHALDLTDEFPVLTAVAPTAVDRLHPAPLEPGDRLDHSIEALRLALDNAEKRWRQLENRLEEQDRAIRALQDELRLSGKRRSDASHPASAPVPELTEIVAPRVAADPDGLAPATSLDADGTSAT